MDRRNTPLVCLWMVLFALMMLSALSVSCNSDHDDDDNDDASDDDDDDNNDDNNDDNDTADEFAAGFARVDITPDVPVKLAGYGLFFVSEAFCRWSTDVHDPLFAQAVAFEDSDGEGPIVLIVVDLIGLVKNDVEAIAQGVFERTGIPPEKVLVAATHTHHGPDTIGLWGVILPPISGRQEPVVQAMLDGAIEAGARAWENREPAVLEYGVGQVADLHENIIEGDPDKTIDDTLTLLSVYDTEGRMLGTMANWAAHPTVMGQDSTVISSDFVGVYSENLRVKLGGEHLFFNGLLGAMIQPSPHWVGPDDWEAVTTLGDDLADYALDLVENATPIDEPAISFFESRRLGVALTNPVFTLAHSLGLIAREFPPSGEDAMLNIASFNLGPVVFGTLPGELVPNYSDPLREAMGGDAQFLIGLGQDWIGYVLTPDQAWTGPYRYESLLCANPQTGDKIVALYRQIQQELP